MAMNPDIKREWVARLRSGRYRQGNNLLHNVKDNTYCCLGVLCEIAVEDGVIAKNKPVDNGAVYDNATTVLPTSVIQWAGLPIEYPTVAIADPEDNGRLVSLAYLNDFRNADFNEIADAIEAHL